jgi:hypothetical protein
MQFMSLCPHLSLGMVEQGWVATRHDVNIRLGQVITREKSFIEQAGEKQTSHKKLFSTYICYFICFMSKKRGTLNRQRKFSKIVRKKK